MIYILTGIAKAGKTLIANEIIKRKNIPLFSTDYIMMMLHRGNPDLDLDVDATDPIVSDKLEPYIHGLLKTIIENKVDYLLEGVHFNPEFASRLLKEFPDDIRILYLGYKDVSSKQKEKELLQYQSHVENPWFLTFKGVDFTNLVMYLIGESKRVFLLCEEYGLTYIDVNDVMLQQDEIIKTLLEQ